jgi:hypothetical protein
MVHVVKYQDGAVAAEVQHWYVGDSPEEGKSHPLDYHAASRFKETRLYGRKQLGVVYLHILKAASADAVEKQVRDNPGALAPLDTGLSQSDKQGQINADLQWLRSSPAI